MDKSPDAGLIKMFFQSVAVVAENREKMIDILSGRSATGQPDKRIPNLVIITGRHSATGLVVLEKPRELHRQHGSLNFIETGITSGIGEDIFSGRTVIAETADHFSEAGIISGDGPGIAESPEIFAGIKTVAGSMGKRARETVQITAAVCLRVVLDDEQSMFTADLPYPLRPGTTAIEMDKKEGASAGRQGGFETVGVELERIRVGVNKDRHKTIFRNGKNGSDICISRDNHFVAGLEQAHLDPCTIDKSERIEAVSATDTMPGANETRIFAFEGFDAGALKIAARGDNFLHDLFNASAEGGRDCFEVKKFNHFSN